MKVVLCIYLNCCGAIKKKTIYRTKIDVVKLCGATTVLYGNLQSFGFYYKEVWEIKYCMD